MTISWPRLLTSSTMLLIAGAIALYVLGRWSGMGDQREREENARTAVWLKARKTRDRVADSLRAMANAAVMGAHRSAGKAISAAGADVALEPALQVAPTAADSTPILVAQRDSARDAARHWQDAFAQMAVARQADSTRADVAEAAADTADQHAERLLQRATSFKIAFLRLPKPRKWMTVVAGCALGGWLDSHDRARGCGIGAAGLTIAVPTH